VRVGRVYQAGVRSLRLLALVSSLGGCDPDILLGARPVNTIPDASSDGGPTEDGPLADAGVSDGSPPGDTTVLDIELTDRGVMPDRSDIPDRDVHDTGAIIDRGPDVPPPTIVWFADHERGDLSQWTAGGAATGGGQYGAGQTEASRDHPHGGSYAAKFTIDTTDGGDHTARLFRRMVSGAAYYSAWFFFPQLYIPETWWSIFLFRAQRDPNDINTYLNLWDLDVERPDGGSLSLSFYNHVTKEFTRSMAPPPIPIGQWVHIEAFFHYVAPDQTRITVWQDGVQVFDLTGLGQPPATSFYWSIGNGSDGLIPRVSTIYVDDAAIATGSRLGPRGGGGGG
jgi:hypothetical protein